MNELEDNSVHSHIMAHYDACYGGDDMTCKDCKHYRPTTDTEGKCKTDADRYYGFDTTVDGKTERDCPSFMPIEDSWESVSK